jgi:hypothetical protein
MSDNTKVGSLDMLEEKDRAIIRRAANTTKRRESRWNISPELKTRAVQALDCAIQVLSDRGEFADVSSCIKTLVAMEGQNQADDHLADKNERLDSGLLTENMAPVNIRVEFDQRG